MLNAAPDSLTRFCKQTLPLLAREVRGRRVVQRMRDLMVFDHWVSFDWFHKSARHIAHEYKQIGAKAHIESIPTGGRIGSGRWVIHEASDVRGATLDVVSPVRRRVFDYRDNGFHVVQWSTGTAPEGVTGELFILRSPEALDAIASGGLAGKIVLANFPLRSLVAKLADKSPAAVVMDIPIPNNPDGVSWEKFGWGGIPIDCAVRLVGLVLSKNQGLRLRALDRKHGPLRLRVKADIHRYQGTHDLVSGIVRGSDLAADELWVLSHNIEPGALDNASGVATCMEIADVLESLIRRGKLARSRRSIRLLHGYECYSFFYFLEHCRAKYGRPVAGVVIDGLGLKPTFCGGRLEWHETVGGSAGFVDDVGESILHAMLKLNAGGYHFHREPFMPTSDTLVGDPQFGFPCPWITTSRKPGGAFYDAYHSSADSLKIMSAAGLKTCAAAMAGYLYYLANLDNEGVVELAKAQAARFDRPPRPAGAARTAFQRDRRHQSIESLKRFVGPAGRTATLAKLNAIQGPARKLQRAAHRGAGRVPRHIAPLAPTLENMPRAIADRVRASGLTSYALFWADGRRTLREIAQRLAVETGKAITPKQVAGYFEAHADLGYIAWA